jgi:hypothetical protein
VTASWAKTVAARAITTSSNEAFFIFPPLGDPLIRSYTRAQLSRKNDHRICGANKKPAFSGRPIAYGTFIALGKNSD